VNADGRVLILMPTVKDGERMKLALTAAALDCAVCRDLEELCREIGSGAGMGLLTEEAIAGDRDGHLADALHRQPAWSDFPLLVLAREGANGQGHLIRESMNATLVERPVRTRSLMSVVRSALRSRRHQFAVRDHLAERQRAEEALRDERERFRITLSSIGDAVIATDTEGAVTFLNEVAERLTGWVMDEARGHSLEEIFRIVNEESRRPVQNPAFRALKEGVIVGLANHTILIAKDGTERPLDDSAAPIRGAGGEIVGAVLVFRDISEKKLAEAAVRESDRRFRTLFETMDEGFCVIEMMFDEEGRPADYRFLEVNPAFEKQTGLPDALGKTMRELAPDHDAHWFDIYGKVALTGEAVRFVNHATALEGRWFNVYAYRVGSALSRKVAILFTDITANKRAEEAQARLAAIVESSEDAIISKTLDGIILSWNAGAERVFGYSSDEVIGKPITLLIPPELLHEERRILEQLARGERIEHFETVRMAKDGRRLDISLTISPIRNRDDKVIGASKIARDITARRLADATLRESEERFRLVADAVPVLIWVSDRSKRCTWFNKAWLEFTGRPMEELVGDGWADDVHPDDFDQCLEVYTTNFEARRAFTMEYRLKRRHGEYRWVEDNGVPRFDGEGVFTGYIGSCVDFTERKDAQEALRRLAADLSQADRKKDDFIALLAHELRNPLAPIRNGLQILRLAGGDMDAVGQARAMMDRQLTHMVRLIDDLLDISRISRNKMELRRERVLLTDVVDSAVETARPQIDEAGHDLSLSLPPGPVFLDADLTRMAQVVANLLTNSAKYTERGGKIQLAAERRGQEVVVTVHDNGIGIPAEALPNIFEMFSQVDRSVERSTGGLGIGLALVRALVEMHGGSVTAESPGEGRGSTFTIRLPVTAGNIAPAVPGDENDGQAASGPKRRILVVDDNRDGAESLAVMLRLLGNEIKTAHDGLQAVAEVERFRPEVILMDVGMPGLNGLEATRRIREQESGRDITIIAVTGWGQDNDRERSREAGCDGHLVKPVNLAELEALLTQICE
jgi:PAS domain S-box-containing protein